MKSRIIAIAALAAAVLSSCVKIDGRMGSGLVDSSLKYDTYTEEFLLENLEMRMADNLSGYSDTRIAIGAIRDDVFGLTTRSSAFTLIPAMDTLDLGKNPKPVKFDIHFAADSISCADASQMHILQNINVYALSKPLSSKSLESGTNKDIDYLPTRISKGVPVYNGTDSLSFEFTKAYAQEYLDKIIPLHYWRTVTHHCSCIWLFPHTMMLPHMSVEEAQKQIKPASLAQAFLNGFLNGEYTFK